MELGCGHSQTAQASHSTDSVCPSSNALFQWVRVGYSPVALAPGCLEIAQSPWGLELDEDIRKDQKGFVGLWARALSHNRLSRRSVISRLSTPSLVANSSWIQSERLCWKATIRTTLPNPCRTWSSCLEASRPLVGWLNTGTLPQLFHKQLLACVGAALSSWQKPKHGPSL